MFWVRSFSHNNCSFPLLLTGGNVSISPQVVSRDEASLVVFVCTVTGLTSPVFSWYYSSGGNQQLLSNSDNNIIIQQQTNFNSTLALVSASRSDAGQYICNVTSLQANTAAVAILTVHCKPVCPQCSSLSFSLPQLLLLSTSSSRTK